jgi:DGQHR domain-containing protein
MTTVKKARWHEFNCTIIKQGKDAPEIAIFGCDAYDLADIATISRITDQDSGYQRIVNKRRKTQISRFVEIPQAAVPTAIVVGIDTNSKYCRLEKRKLVAGSSNRWDATLRLRSMDGYKPCLIIDGQHRLEGIISSSRDSYPIAVTGLLDPSPLVQMSNFYVINNKATRVSTAHTNELLGAMAELTQNDKQQLDVILGQLGIKNIDAQAFVSELNEPGMVFSGLLDFPSNKIQLVSSRELRNLIEASRRANFLSYIDEDDPLQLACYNDMWLGVRDAFTARWNYELSIAQDVAAKKRGKKELNANKKLFHSGSIAVLGMELDKQLMSLPYRRLWHPDPSVIADLVAKDILKKVPKTFWDLLDIENTQKGKQDLQAALHQSMG